MNTTQATCPDCGKVFSSLDWSNPSQAMVEHRESRHARREHPLRARPR